MRLRSSELEIEEEKNKKKIEIGWKKHLMEIALQNWLRIFRKFDLWLIYKYMYIYQINIHIFENTTFSSHHSKSNKILYENELWEIFDDWTKSSDLENSIGKWINLDLCAQMNNRNTHKIIIQSLKPKRNPFDSK